MGLGLGLGAAAILWLADQWSLDGQRAQLEGLVGLSADRIAETIHRAAHDGMLRNDAEGVRRIIENIGAQEGIDRVRIYNKEGRVRVSSVPAEEGTLIGKQSEECIACHSGPQPRAGLERALRIRMLPGPRRRAHPGHHQPDLQREGVRRVPRAPRLAARARRARRAALDGAGRRGARRLGAPDAVRDLRHRPRRAAAELPDAVGLRAAAGAAAAPGDGARRRGRPHGARPGALERRDGGARPLLEPDHRRPAARARGAARPEPHARAAHRREDAPARGDAPPDAGGREDGLARQAGRRGGARDQQPARGHPHLRARAAAAVRRGRGRTAHARSGPGDRPHPRDGGRRGRPLRRHRAEPARVQPRHQRALLDDRARSGRRALSPAAPPPGRDAGGHARDPRPRGPAAASCATPPRSSRCCSRSR